MGEGPRLWAEGSRYANNSARDNRVIVGGGYCDLQVNGGWGHHFSEDPATIWNVAERLLAHGVTMFLPTLISDGFGLLDEALDVLAAGPPLGWVGARPVGLHLEGPWLNPKRVGAHNRLALRPPPMGSDLPDRLRASEGVLLVTLAPELPGALELIVELRARGVVVSLGHSEASFAEATAGIRAGATMGTHLFNAMSGLHHRAPGLAAALLDDPDVRVGLIADGHHVAPEMVRLAWRMASEHTILVSDAVSLLGTPGFDVARLPDGTIAGGVVGIDECVRNVCRFTNCSIELAAAAASNAPRAVLGIVASPGDEIELDSAGRVIRTQLANRLVWSAE